MTKTTPAPSPLFGPRWHLIALVVSFLFTAALSWTGVHLWVNHSDLFAALPDPVVRYAGAPICRLQAFVFIWCLTATLLERWEAGRSLAPFAFDDVDPAWKRTTLLDVLTLHFVQDQRRRTAFLQLTIWLLPILGFIGTVEGITRAIAGLEINALQAAAADASAVPRGMAEVMGGMKYAFDTTMVGLVLMIPLVIMSTVFRGELETVYAAIQQRVLHPINGADAPPDIPVAAEAGLSAPNP